MHKLLSTIITLLLLSSVALTQSITIRGIVRDADSFEPLTGASVTITGTTRGASTNQDGEFSFLLSFPRSVSIISVGMQRETLRVNNQLIVPTSTNLLLFQKTTADKRSYRLIRMSRI